jgi:ferric iron reductase protein FhuF
MTTVSLNTHPIEQTLARLAAIDDDYIRPYLLAGPDAEAGWLSAAQLTAAGAAHLDEALDRVAARYKAEGRQPAVSLWFGHYAFSVMAVAIACYLAERRVPDLAPENAWLRFDEHGDAAAFAWRGRAFVGLDDDPDAGHPDCTVLPSREALREHLRERIIAHLAPLVDALRARSSFGRPGLWALAADSSASAFTWIGELMGDSSIGIEEARIFNAPPSPLQRKRDFIHVEHCGLSYQMVDRASCCLYYKVEDGEYCTSCPHRPRDERIERVRARLEREAVGVVQE